MARLPINVLTLRQEAIHTFICNYFNTNGFSPSIREIGANFKIASSSALDHLRALERKGFIRRIPQKPRCMEILK